MFVLVANWRRKTLKLFQTLSFAMYFAVSWLEPRLVVNKTAPEWTVEKTGPKDVSRNHLFNSKTYKF